MIPVEFFYSRTTHTIVTQTYLCTAVSYDILSTATAPVSACLQPTRCLAARTARVEIRQAGRHAHKLEETLYTSTQHETR